MDQPVQSIDHRVAMNCYVCGCVSLGYHLMVFQIWWVCAVEKLELEEGVGTVNYPKNIKVEEEGRTQQSWQKPVGKGQANYRFTRESQW